MRQTVRMCSGLEDAGRARVKRFGSYSGGHLVSSGSLQTRTDKNTKPAEERFVSASKKKQSQFGGFSLKQQQVREEFRPPVMTSAGGSDRRRRRRDATNTVGMRPRRDGQDDNFVFHRMKEERGGVNIACSMMRRGKAHAAPGWSTAETSASSDLR